MVQNALLNKRIIIQINCDFKFQFKTDARIFCNFVYLRGIRKCLVINLWFNK